MARSLLFLSLLLVAVSVVHAGIYMPFTDCGSTKMKFVSVYQEQDLVYRGREVGSNTTIEILEDMEGGSFRFSAAKEVFGRNITISTPKLPMCRLLFGRFGECSLQKGDVLHLTYQRRVPRIIPSGMYTVTLQAWDGNGDRVACVIVPVPVENNEDYVSLRTIY